MKKQLEETIPESTKQLAFSSLRSEIEYLREQNRTRTLVIKQLTENKAMTYSCNVVSTSKDHADKNKESANSLENNEISNKILNQTKKPDEKTLTDNHNTKNKDSNQKNRGTTTEKRTIQRTKIVKKTKTLRKKRPKTKAMKRTRRLRRKTRKVFYFPRNVSVATRRISSHV